MREGERLVLLHILYHVRDTHHVLQAIIDRLLKRAAGKGHQGQQSSLGPGQQIGYSWRGVESRIPSLNSQIPISCQRLARPR
jgi:hypothetical protein